MATPRSTRVVISTALGDIEADVYEEAAPITAGNFLKHVDAGTYQGGTMHRVVTMENQRALEAASVNPDAMIEVIQAAGVPELVAGAETIPLERTTTTGITHLDGTLSMARMEPDSAVEGFFICVGDQPSLDFGGARNPDGQGFAAFGRVTAGMDVVRAIHTSPHVGQRLEPLIAITSITRA